MGNIIYVSQISYISYVSKAFIYFTNCLKPFKTAGNNSKFLELV